MHSEDDIVRAILTAEANGTSVRAIGSGGSKNGNYETTGIQLDLSEYDRVTEVAGNLVTVQAGMPVAKLFAIADALGLALPTVGEWRSATVAGAVSTGTHGGSLGHGCFSTSLAAIRLINGEGEVICLRRGDAAFRHAGVALGLLGVLSELTFECSERFQIRLERRSVSFERFLATRDRTFREHEFTSAVWFPGARQTLVFTGNRCVAPPRPSQRPCRYDVGTLLLHTASRWVPPAARLSGPLLRRVSSGPSHTMLAPIGTTPGRVRWLRRLAPSLREAEFAVPIEHSERILDALDRFLHGWSGALRLPVGLRATARDDFSLSPCSDRDVLWIAIFYREERQFAAALGAFFAGFLARCHWGKNFVLGAGHLRGQYPAWDAFRAQRARMDPAGLFQNAFTRELGL